MQDLLLYEGIPQLLTLVISYILLWSLSCVAGLIMSAVIGVYLVWMLYLNLKVVEVCVPIDSEFRRINRHRTERWDKIERVKTNGKENEETIGMTAWFDKALVEDRAFWLWYIKQNTMRGIVNVIGLTAIIIYGAWLVWSRQWSIGLLYPLFSWSTKVSENIWQIGHVEHQLNWNMPAVRAMIDALSIPPDILDSASLVKIAKTHPIGISFKDVSHTYPIETDEDDNVCGKAPVPVLKNINFKIEAGEKAAIIGPSGAGKTTLMRLALRFMDPEEGSIYLNGYNLRDIKSESLMHHVGYIPQNAQVFDGTIRYNLTYGLLPEIRDKISDKELWDLMQLLKIDFGARLTDGLDTIVGRNGIKLSGGQAQRLMIGAAVIKRPLFMVIDEATSSLDSSTEKAVQQGLAEILNGPVTALVVAHRLSTVRHLCNKFIVLRNSEDVVADEPQIEAIAASFEELYQKSSIFRGLANDQNIIISK